MSSDIIETDQNGTRCLSVYIPLAELTVMYWSGSHKRTRSLQSLFNCGAQVDSLSMITYGNQIDPQCVLLQPFQILVICSDALVHLSQQDGPSAFLKFQINDPSLLKTSECLADTAIFQSWLKTNFNYFDEPIKFIHWKLSSNRSMLSAGKTAGVMVTPGKSAGGDVTAGNSAGVVVTAGETAMVIVTEGETGGVVVTEGETAGVVVTAGKSAGVAVNLTIAENDTDAQVIPQIDTKCKSAGVGVTEGETAGVVVTAGKSAGLP